MTKFIPAVIFYVVALVIYFIIWELFKMVWFKYFPEKPKGVQFDVIGVIKGSRQLVIELKDEELIEKIKTVMEK